MKINSNYIGLSASGTILGWAGLALWTGAGLFSHEAGSGAIGGLAVTQLLAMYTFHSGLKAKAGVKEPSPWSSVGRQFDSRLNTGINSVMKTLRIRGRTAFEYTAPQLRLQSKRNADGLSYSTATNTYFVEDKPAKKKASDLFDEVYFGRVYPQVPGSALWLFLRHAEQNRLRGKGMSERYWVGRCNKSWWSPRWYKPIGVLLDRAERTHGVQLVMQHANQWKELLHSATFTWNAIIASEFPDQFESQYERTFGKWGSDYIEMHWPPGPRM